MLDSAAGDCGDRKSKLAEHTLKMKGPPNHITVQETCERLCVSRSTFYEYYRRRLVTRKRHRKLWIWLPLLESIIRDEVKEAEASMFR